jgi:leucyl-tRNA---protein transferase
MSVFQKNQPHFYLTPTSPCAYLEGEEERKIFTPLVGKGAAEMYDGLSAGGFRRSQSIVYRPACELCNACVSLRVLVNDFKPNKTHKKILARNADLLGKVEMTRPNTEQYSLFRDYVRSRHGDGGMANMSMLDYTLLVEETYVRTRVVEYRERGPDHFIVKRGQGALKAVALTDVLADGLSMVYTFYDPDEDNRSLGTMMILDHIERARAMGLAYVYLGFWVKNSPKMSYKANFKPHEIMMKSGWERVD